MKACMSADSRNLGTAGRDWNTSTSYHGCDTCADIHPLWGLA